MTHPSIRVVLAKAGTHNHRGYSWTISSRRLLILFASLVSEGMGPRFREDDGGVFVGALRKFSDSNFKQPSAYVLAPPRELGF